MAAPTRPPLTIAAGSRVDVVARPALPGLRLEVDGIAGTVPADGSQLGDHRFSCSVRAQAEGRAAVTTPLWLRGGPVRATGRVTALDRSDPGGTVVTVEVELGGRRLVLAGTGRTRRVGAGPHGDGVLEVAGAALCDPRALGIALPPLITHVLTVRWQLRLTMP